MTSKRPVDPLVLELTPPPDDAGKTSDELAMETGVTLEVIQRRLKLLVAQGRVVVGKRAIKDSMGRVCRVPVYRLEIVAETAKPKKGRLT